MRNIHWLEVLLAMMSLFKVETVEMDSVECGTKATSTCSCGSNHYMLEERSSTFYQLRNQAVGLAQNATFQIGAKDLWYTRSDPAGFWKDVPYTSTLQVRRLGRGVIIQYMDDNLDGTQYKYFQKNETGESNILYETGWATARVGKKVSLPFENKEDIISIRPGQRQAISFNVTGNPTPTILVTKNGVDQGSTVFKLEDGILQFTPVDASVIYSVTATNCFNSVSGKLYINTQSNASTDTRDGSVTAVCGGSVNLACNGTGNPIPSVKWIYPPTVSRQKADNDSQSYTRLGGYKLRYNRHLVNVLPSSRGIYQCLLESGFGDAKKVEFQLSVMCVPDSPYVNVSGVNASTITLVISSPLYTGGMPIRNYSIVYEDHSPVSLDASSDRVDTSIEFLNSKTLYTISVRAWNDMGTSTAAVISTRTHGIPDMIVFNTSIQEASQRSAKCDEVTFVIPAVETGGSPVLEYYLIYSHSGGSIQEKTVWGDVATVDNLEGGQNYSIQVRAKNAYGYGLFSDPLTIETPECSSSENTSGSVWMWIVIAVVVVAVTVIITVIVIHLRRKRAQKKLTNVDERSDPNLTVVYLSPSETRLQDSQIATEPNACYGVITEKKQDQ